MKFTKYFKVKKYKTFSLGLKMQKMQDLKEEVGGKCNVELKEKV